VIAYSAFSTFAVNYAQFTTASREKDSTQDEINRNRLLIELNRKEQNSARQEIGALEADGEFWRERSWRRYDTIQAAVSERQQRLRLLQAEEARLVNETPQALIETAVARETVYSFLSGVLETGEEAVRFLIYIIPAILFDVLSPFALSVVLFLIDKRRKEI
jgi:hypothetical protein